MNIAKILLVLIPFFILLWFSIVGTVAVKNDDTLEPFQRKAQIVIVWLFPFFGAGLILYLVNQHSPEVISRMLIPWPFRMLVLGKQINQNLNRDNNKEAGINLAISSQQHNHYDSGGGMDAGGSND
jgi:hypothetical protein